MEEKYRRFYESLGYTGPALPSELEASVVTNEGGPGVLEEVAEGLPEVPAPQEDWAEVPPLGPEGIDELEEMLNTRPEETLAKAREVFDERISEAELRANIARARMALRSPELAVAVRETESALFEVSNQLPPGFTFEGMDLNEIDIKPGDIKFETVADWAGWLFLAGPFVLTKGPRDKFRWHNGAASRFVYDLEEPTAAAPLEVALFSDFGTGRYHSQYIAKQLRVRKFPYAFHLGDVYYAGRRSEFRDFFAAPLDPILADTRLFALNSNHEMYSAGKPYYEFMDRRRNAHPEKQQQEGSYFCLRSSRFQIVGIDTAYFGHGRFEEQALRDWLTQTLREGKNAGRVNVLLSADHPYNYGSEGHSDLLQKDLAGPAINDRLVDLWFWGNTHYCALFDRDASSPFIGSCIGHGGYPYDRQATGKNRPAPLLFLETAPRFPGWTELRQDRGNNGYCVMSLRADGSVGLRYVDWMARVRCEAALSRTAGNRLEVASVEEKPF